MVSNHMMRGVGVVLTGSKVKTGDVIFDRPDFPQSIDFVTDFTIQKFRRDRDLDGFKIQEKYPETTLDTHTRNINETTWLNNGDVDK